MKTALVILADGFEEIEAVTPVDLLRRAGVGTTVASLGPDLLVTGKNQLRLKADALLDEAAGQPPDLLVLPGGPGVKHLRADARVLRMAREQYDAGRLIGAICAAPLVLLDAGILPGRRHTAHPSTAAEWPGDLSPERVVIDLPVITSRGAGTAVDFGLALLEHLLGKEPAEAVKSAVCA